ncbi:hypothetical protein [Lactiplantibacillus paraxiangfangensis]|uniref:hypothetical protein n=1 Tax=Lactiplantibacillus paraxiangfangensis TaxID=3076224 RepID=UPI0030C738F7
MIRKNRKAQMLKLMVALLMILVLICLLVLAVILNNSVIAQCLGVVSTLLLLSWTVYISLKRETANVSISGVGEQGSNGIIQKVRFINPDDKNYVVQLTKVEVIVDGHQENEYKFPINESEIAEDNQAHSEWPKLYILKSGDKKTLFTINWNEVYEEYQTRLNVAKWNKNNNQKVLLHFYFQIGEITLSDTYFYSPFNYDPFNWAHI